MRFLFNLLHLVLRFTPPLLFCAFILNVSSLTFSDSYPNFSFMVTRRN